MNKFEIVGLVVVGTVIGNRICDVGDYIYKKRKRAKAVSKAHKCEYRESIAYVADKITIEELIDQYGDLL